MARFALTLEFDGGPFCGLQRQAHGPSVQQAVEEAVLAVTGETVTIHAAGRTDAGVHALAMRAHVDVAKADCAVPADGSAQRPSAARPRLRFSPAKSVPDDWHARFSCIGRAISTASPTAARR